MMNSIKLNTFVRRTEEEPPDNSWFIDVLTEFNEGIAIYEVGEKVGKTEAETLEVARDLWNHGFIETVMTYLAIGIGDTVHSCDVINSDPNKVADIMSKHGVFKRILIIRNGVDGPKLIADYTIEDLKFR